MIKKFIILFSLISCLFCSSKVFANESDFNDEPMFWHEQFFSTLVDKMYCVSETTGTAESYQAIIEKFRQRLAAKLAAGLDPNEKNEYGQTPLMYAAKFGYPELVEELLKRPEVVANINIKDVHQQNALDYASESYGLSAFFTNPSLIIDPFCYVPFITQLSYYSHKDESGLTPYDKCICLLTRKGAKEGDISLKQRMAHQLEEVIEELCEILTQIPDEEEAKEVVCLLIEIAQQNLLSLANYVEGTSFGEFCLTLMEGIEDMNFDFDDTELETRVSLN